MLTSLLVVAGLLVLGSLTGSVLLAVQQVLARRWGYEDGSHAREVFKAQAVAIVACLVVVVAAWITILNSGVGGC